MPLNLQLIFYSQMKCFCRMAISRWNFDLDFQVRKLRLALPVTALRRAKKFIDSLLSKESEQLIPQGGFDRWREHFSRRLHVNKQHQQWNKVMRAACPLLSIPDEKQGYCFSRVKCVEANQSQLPSPHLLSTSASFLLRQPRWIPSSTQTISCLLI